MAFYLSFLAGVVFFYSFGYFQFATVTISILFIALLIFRKRYLLVPVIAAGILYALLRYTPEDAPSFIHDKEMLVSGTFVSESVMTPLERFMQTFRLDSAGVAMTKEPVKELRGIDINVISDTEFEIGNKYELLVKVSRDSTRYNPGLTKNGNIYVTLIEVRGVKEGKKTIWAIFEDARVALDRYITKNFNADPGSFVSSITTGQRVNMSEELRDAFNSTGLAHILSISGTHFGIFSVFLFGIFRFLIKVLPYKVFQRITIYIAPSQGAAILSLPFMIAYLGLSGWSIPAVRSFIMISLFLIGLLIGRKGFWLNSLLFSAFVIVLWSPEALFSLSFQLSFLAVLFIGFSIGYMEDKESAETGKSVSTEDKNFLPRFITSMLHIFRTSLLISLAASFGTAPLVAYYFHYFSVISPISNLLITPLIGFVLLPLSLISSFIFLLTGHYVFIPLVRAIADLTVYLVMSISRFPFADIKISAFPIFVLICFYSSFAFYFLFNKKKLLLIIPFALIIGYLSIAAIMKKHDINITYLDVGQGDSSVLELPDNKIIVIDTGRSGKEAAAFIKYRGRKIIDSLVLSHVHPDHTGGLDYLMRHFKIKELWDNGRLIYPEKNFEGIEHRIFERGAIVEGNGYKIYVLHPYKEFYTLNGNDYDEENNSSLALKIEGKGKSFLFSGDVEEEAEEDISHLYKWLKSDVIKVPHHGGKTSASQIFFNEVSPQIALISAGRDNSFGHPHQEMLELLGNSKIYRTDRDGAVKITEKDGKLEAKTYKDFQFAKAKSFRDEMKNIKRLFTVW